MITDSFGFPKKGMPLLRDVNNNAKVNILQVNGINPQLGNGFLYHATNTGAISINSNIVTGIYSGDGYTYTSGATGNVYLYLDTYTLSSVFVPYTGAQNDVNIGTYSFISSSATSGSTTDYPYSSSFTTSYTPVSAGTVYCYTSSGDLYDYYSDGYLYDSTYTIQGTIDYPSGYVDTTGYNSWNIEYISYSYGTAGYTTSVSYGGSTFTNGIVVTKNDASYAGNFSDGTNTVYLGDGTNSITANSDIEITDYTKGIIRRSPNGTRWIETIDDTGTLVITSL